MAAPLPRLTLKAGRKAGAATSPRRANANVRPRADQHSTIGNYGTCAAFFRSQLYTCCADHLTPLVRIVSNILAKIRCGTAEACGGQISHSLPHCSIGETPVYLSI